MSSKLVSSALKSAINLHSSKLPKEIIKSSQAWFAAAPSGGVHSLPELPYAYNALEPVISAETMTLHHTKHHQAYVTNLNAALEKLDAAISKGDVSAIIALQGALRFNGGGHLNHSLFWENLASPNSGVAKIGPTGSLKKQIEANFCTVDELKKQLVAKTIAVQGSGWGWLGYNKEARRLEIATCANQDPLEATAGLVPLLGIDVWEHAYYVDYRNVRPDYVNAVWSIVNWEVVGKRLDAASA